MTVASYADRLIYKLRLCNRDFGRSALAFELALAPQVPTGPAAALGAADVEPRVACRGQPVITGSETDLPPALSTTFRAISLRAIDAGESGAAMTTGSPESA